VALLYQSCCKFPCRIKISCPYRKIFSLIFWLVYVSESIGASPGEFIDATGCFAEGSRDIPSNWGHS